MGILMIGIDYNQASVEIRELFSFTKKKAEEALKQTLGKPGIQGCIILSTCNRTELWVSTGTRWNGNLYELLCELKGIQVHRDCFVEREEERAVEHLFHLAGGLKSQIFGEDQILTQVKDALSLARENFATDNVLEVLFRMAVTVGKKIKTKVKFSHGSSSVIHHVIRHLQRDGYSLAGKTCMVIGNGEMGKISAGALREAGADVTITVRQYKSGMVNIPTGCRQINYGERMEYLPLCDLVVSATASPHYTLQRDMFADIVLDKPVIFVDLAVPRDIEPELGEREEIILYDIDQFSSEDVLKQKEESMRQAASIVSEQMKEFDNWYKGKELIPQIQQIKTDVVNDFNLRIQKVICELPVDEKEREELFDKIDTAAEKVINKLIFGIRDCLELNVFSECITGLEKLYEK